MGKWTTGSWAVLTSASLKKLFSMFQYGRINQMHLLERFLHWQKERYTTGNLAVTGTVGAGTYGALNQIPVCYLDTDAKVTNIEFIQTAVDGTVASSSKSAWVTLKYTDDDHATDNVISHTTLVSGVVTVISVRNEDVPDGAMVYLEVDIPNTETLLGTCNVALVRTEL